MMGFDLEQIQHRNHELQRQAQHHRLLRYVRGRRSGPAATVLAWAGRRLISLGEMLQPRQAPAYPYPLTARERVH